MSKINELIKKLCPNGVEYKKVWQITTWDKKYNSVDKAMQPKTIKYNYLLANQLNEIIVDNGDVLILETGINHIKKYTNENLAGENLCNGEIIAIPWGGTPNVKYYNGKFVTGDNRIAVSNDINVLNTKFLYYIFENKMNEIADFYRGSGIKHPEMKKVLNLDIPIPPIKVQKEIVQILDKFGELEAELEAELETRNKQYEFWRDKILGNTKETYVNLGSLCKIITKGTTPKKYVDSGVNFIKTESFVGDNVDKSKLSFVDKETHNGFLKRSILETNDILFTIAGATIGKMTVVTEDLLPANTNQALAIIRLNDGVNLNYIKHILKSDYMKEYIKVCVKGSAQPNLNLQQLNNFKFPFPSSEEQNHIVNILDKFDLLINDISVGIPAEIELRRQQYEYYRNKLLSFEEVHDV